MSQQRKTFPKLATSCLLFDSPKFERILLIQRENEPEKGLWSFPGGKLELGESITEGMVREVYEETGFKVSVVDESLFNIAELKDSNYLIISGMAFLSDLVPSTERRRKKDLRITTKYFSLDENRADSIWRLKDEECIANLKPIVAKFMKTYKQEKEDKVEKTSNNTAATEIQCPNIAY